MWIATASVLPLTIVLGVLVAVTKPLGSDSVLLVVGVLAAAGIALTCAGALMARGRRR